MPLPKLTPQNVQDMAEKYADAVDGSERQQARQEYFDVSYDLLLMNLAREELNNAEKVLEIGCGSATVTNYLDSCGIDITGVDIRRDGWRALRESESNPAQLLQADAEQLPVQDDSADAILMCGALEHFGVFSAQGKNREYTPEVKAAKQRALSEICRVGKPGSSVLITKYPNRLSLDKIYSQNRWFSNGKIYDSSSGHQPSERARPNELKSLVSDYLEIDSIVPAGVLPQKIPKSTSDAKAEIAYTKLNATLSRLPIIREFAQCYNIIAHVPQS